jgi:hypothetical protein
MRRSSVCWRRSIMISPLDRALGSIVAAAKCSSAASLGLPPCLGCLTYPYAAVGCRRGPGGPPGALLLAVLRGAFAARIDATGHNRLDHGLDETMSGRGNFSTLGADLRRCKSTFTVHEPVLSPKTPSRAARARRPRPLTQAARPRSAAAYPRPPGALPRPPPAR